MLPRQFEQLLQIVGAQLEPKRNTNYAIPAKHKLLITLRFYAQNLDLSTLFDAQGPSKASLSRFIRQTTIVLIEALGYNIKWPTTEAENREMALQYSKMTKFGLPNCVGSIDGSLVPILSPNSKKFNHNAYWSRKSCYAINVLGNYKFNLS